MIAAIVDLLTTWLWTWVFIVVMIVISGYVNTEPVRDSVPLIYRINRVSRRDVLGVIYVFLLVIILMLVKGWRLESEGEQRFLLWALAAFGFLAGIVIGVATDFDKRSRS